MFLKDYVQLQTKMVSSLEKHYTSEHINNSDEISAGWNNFFYQGNTNERLQQFSKNDLQVFLLLFVKFIFIRVFKLNNLKL